MFSRLAIDPNNVQHLKTCAMLEGMTNATTERYEAYLMTNAQELQDANLNAWLQKGFDHSPLTNLYRY